MLLKLPDGSTLSPVAKAKVCLFVSQQKEAINKLESGDCEEGKVDE